MSHELRVDGWLYLLRPALALLTVGFAAVLWAIDRREARRERAAALLLSTPPLSWWVECMGQRFPVIDTLTIGRSPENSVVLTDPAASALHAAISRSVNGARLEDLGSRNGTLWRGQLVKAPIPLSPGDDIQIGDVVLRVGTGETPWPSVPGPPAPRGGASDRK